MTLTRAKLIGLVSLTLVATFLLAQTYFFSWDAVEQSMPEKEAIAGHAQEAGKMLRPAVVPDVANEQLDAELEKSRAKAEKVIIAASNVASNVGGASVESKPAVVTDNRAPCGHGAAGKVTTVHLSKDITATFCASKQQSASTVLAAVTSTPIAPHYTDPGPRPLFVGVTSPCGNVGFREQRRKEFLSKEAGFPDTARYLYVPHAALSTCCLHTTCAFARRTTCCLIGECTGTRRFGCDFIYD